MGIIVKGEQMKNALTATALMVASLLCFPAIAAPVNALVADGETFCESNNHSVFSASECDLGGNRDLSNWVSSRDKITFLGDGRLAGFVADGPGVGNGNYPDYATIKLAKASKLTFKLLSPQTGFDAAFAFGNLASTALSGANPSISFFAEAGEYFFALDATKPSDSPTKLTTSYELSVTAIPLPAGAVLLLSGLAGFGVMRRRARQAV